MPSIRNIHATLNSFVELQSDVVSAFNAELQNLETDIRSSARTLSQHAEALVLVENNERYAALTRAARKSGSGENLSALVEAWTQQDLANREERKALDKTWGALQEVAQKSSVLRTEISEINKALEEISPEVRAFEETTQKIKEHNRKYPSSPITEENHDAYEKFSLGRWCLWALRFGMYGPHKAYQLISAYDKKYGDYYEDAQQAVINKENEKKLQAQVAEKEKAAEQLETVMQKMQSLDGSYKGAEKIANDVRAMVVALYRKEGFAEAVFGEIADDHARLALLAQGKLHAFAKILEVLSSQKQQAETTLRNMKEPLVLMEGRTAAIGDNQLFVDITGMEGMLQQAAKASRQTIREAQRARDAVDDYALPQTEPAQHLQDVSRILMSNAKITVQDNRLTFDLSALKSGIKQAIEVYEAEQRRIAEERRRREEEARRVQEAALAAARAAARAAEARRSASISSRSSSSIGGGFGGISGRSSSSIGGGSRGIGGRSSGSIGGGSRGIGGGRR